MKKFLALLMAATMMMAVLAGCGGTNNGSSNAGNTTNNTATNDTANNGAEDNTGDTTALSGTNPVALELSNSSTTGWFLPNRSVSVSSSVTAFILPKVNR